MTIEKFNIKNDETLENLLEENIKDNKVTSENENENEKKNIFNENNFIQINKNVNSDLLNVTSNLDDKIRIKSTEIPNVKKRFKSSNLDVDNDKNDDLPMIDNKFHNCKIKKRKDTNTKPLALTYESNTLNQNDLCVNETKSTSNNINDNGNKLKVNSSKKAYKTFYCHIDNKLDKDINTLIKHHYNERAYQSKVQGSRKLSPIYKLRNFNSIIKYILLGKFIKFESNKIFSKVLDLCCGKGGDLNKYQYIGIGDYIGIDISNKSIKEACSRYNKSKYNFKTFNNNKNHNSSRFYNFNAYFATGDCFTDIIPDILEPKFPGIIQNLFPVECVTIQFALHYAFESEKKVRTVLKNISKSLKPGGIFIGTVPSYDCIKDMIIKKKYTNTEDGKIKFGNNLYSVVFDKNPIENGNLSPFGCRYFFSLKDAIDDIPEYVVSFDILKSLCDEFGLTLKYKKDFISIFNSEIPKFFSKLNKKLVDGIKKKDGSYGIEGAEKEAASFYIAFVFEKSNFDN